MSIILTRIESTIHPAIRVRLPRDISVYNDPSNIPYICSYGFLKVHLKQSVVLPAHKLVQLGEENYEENSTEDCQDSADDLNSCLDLDLTTRILRGFLQLALFDEV